MTEAEKWLAVFRALDQACDSLRADGWPKRRRPRKSAHMTGYSRAHGRRAIVRS